MAQLGTGAAFWFVGTDSIVLRIFALVLATRGVSQFVIAYLNHPDRLAKRDARKELPPSQDS